MKCHPCFGLCHWVATSSGIQILRSKVDMKTYEDMVKQCQAQWWTHLQGRWCRWGQLPLCVRRFISSQDLTQCAIHRIVILLAKTLFMLENPVVYDKHYVESLVRVAQIDLATLGPDLAALGNFISLCRLVDTPM